MSSTRVSLRYDKHSNFPQCLPRDQHQLFCPIRNLLRKLFYNIDPLFLFLGQGEPTRTEPSNNKSQALIMILGLKS